jgi:hypothetical protein
MKRNGSAPTVRMTVLLVRALLTDLLKPKALQDRYNLAWLENRHLGHD